MANLKKIISQMKTQPQNVRFTDVVKVCTQYFGEPRQYSGSHMIFKTPWQGDPRINLQANRNLAKAYQVKQVLAALEMLKSMEI